MSHPDTKGFFEVAARCYGATDEHPDGGLMSSVIRRLLPHDEVVISGPHGRVGYVGHGTLRVRSEGPFGAGPNGILKTNHFAMILGGSGIFPGFAITQKILQDPRDPTSVSMIYCVSSSRQFVLLDSLKSWAELHRRRFKLETIAAEVAEGDTYTGATGEVTEALLRKSLPPPSLDPLICLIGPPNMCSGHVRPLLRILGHDVSRIVPF